MPTVSIVVPVYNVEAYLHQCVDSVLAQTYTDLELILVNDGSKDTSPAICDEYAKLDSRVKVIHKVNGGVSAARNTGIDSATGKYIAFCDSDDYLEPRWVEELVGAISAAPTAWCFCGCHTVAATGQYVEETCVFHKAPIHETLPMSAYPEVYSANYSACLWLRVFNLDIIRTNNIRFDPKLSVSEDVLFSLQYGAFCTEFSVVNLPLYNHRVYLNNEVDHLDGKLPKEMFYLNCRIYSARKVLIAEENLRSFETDFFYRFINDIKSVCRLPISVQEKKVKIREILGSKEFRCCLKNADTSKESHKLLWLLRLRFSSLIQKIFAP